MTDQPSFVIAYLKADLDSFPWTRHQSKQEIEAGHSFNKGMFRIYQLTCFGRPSSCRTKGVVWFIADCAGLVYFPSWLCCFSRIYSIGGEAHLDSWTHMHFLYSWNPEQVWKLHRQVEEKSFRPLLKLLVVPFFLFPTYVIERNKER